MRIRGGNKHMFVDCCRCMEQITCSSARKETRPKQNNMFTICKCFSNTTQHKKKKKNSRKTTQKTIVLPRKIENTKKQKKNKSFVLKIKIMFDSHKLFFLKEQTRTNQKRKRSQTPSCFFRFLRLRGCGSSSKVPDGLSHWNLQGPSSMERKT